MIISQIYKKSISEYCHTNTLSHVLSNNKSLWYSPSLKSFPLKLSIKAVLTLFLIQSLQPKSRMEKLPCSVKSEFQSTYKC